MNPLTNTTPETTPTLVNFPPPLHLKHRPIYMIPYESFDGPYADNTDAKYLSVGLAQWRDLEDPRDTDLSAKTWRYGDGKWSRMSEEMPLHRMVDLCLLTARCMFDDPGPGTVVLPAGTFAKQAQAMEARRLEDYPADFDSRRQQLKPHLRALRDTLNSLELDD